MDYRKLYKEFYEIEFPTSMEVHHINGNREDNSIHNLLLLPKDTHNKMHYCNGLMDGIDMSVREMAKRAYNLACEYGGQSCDLMAINEFSEVVLECTAWGLLKHLEYRKPSGEKITNIDESAIKWITTRG